MTGKNTEMCPYVSNTSSLVFISVLYVEDILVASDFENGAEKTKQFFIKQ